MDDNRVTPLRVQDFAQNAKPHEKLVYFVGNLGEERAKDREVATLANTAYKAFEQGECTLLQRRYGRPDEGATIYILEKRAS